MTSRNHDTPGSGPNPLSAYVAFGAGVRTSPKRASEVGGKAAGLIAMASMGLPVPPGVVLPVQVLDDTDDRHEFAELVSAAVRDLERVAGRRLGDAECPLLVSVRSGAAVSMPGMMDTVLDVGATPEVIDAIARATGDAGFAADTHRRFLVGYATVVAGLPVHEVGELADTADTPTDLAAALLARGVEIPAEPTDQIIATVAAVHRSWHGERAQAFRRREGIAADLGTAVTIQAMVFGNLGDDSGTGVAFSRDPSTGAAGIVGDLLVGAQGDDVVGGGHITLRLDDVANRWPAVHSELIDAIAMLERQEADMVDVEFTVEQGRLFLLQCRPGRRSTAAALRMAVEMAEDPEFPLDRAGAVARCRDLLTTTAEGGPGAPPSVADHHVVARGLPASPGRGTGALVVSIDDALDRHDAGEAVVLVRPETSPADVAAMSVAAGIVTSTGGIVSHAAIVARSWDLPAVVGAGDLQIDADGITVDGRRVAVGEIVTVDGSAGVLWIGDHAGVAKPPPELEVLRRWAAALDDPDHPWLFRDVDSAEHESLIAMMDATDRWDAVRSARTWVLDRAAPGSAGPALDVGCGPGTFTAEARTRRWATIDLDRSHTMVRTARSRDRGSIGAVADVGRLPFADRTFGLVHCERVLQWTDDPAAAMEELWRVTADGGRLAVTDTDWSSVVVNGVDSTGAEQISSAALDWVPHPTFARSIARRLDELGATDVETRADVVVSTQWDPDDPAQLDGPPGLPLRTIVAAAAPADRPAAAQAVSAIAERARGGEFSAALTIVTAVARRRIRRTDVSQKN